MRTLLVTLVGWALLLPVAVEAQTPGTPFSSIEAGVQMTLPPGEVRRRGGPNPPKDLSTLAVVENEAGRYRFELRRLRLDEPRDLRTDVAADGTRTEGLLDTYTLEVQRNLGGDLLRRGLAPLPDADAGVFAIRYSTGVDTRLHQEAIIQGDDRTIFRLTMVSEAPGGPVERMSADENVRRSVKLFNDAFASFALIDQAALADEQDKRLRKTRAMFVQLGPRGNLASAAQGEFFLAIQRNGETIGVAHVIEEPADLLPPTSFEAFEDAKVRGPALEPLLANGVRVGIRMRLRDGDAILDRATWSYASRELDIGDFREHTRRVPLGGEPVDEADTGVSVGTVIGQMRSRRVPVRGEPQSRGPGLGERQTFEIKDQRKLEVVFTVDGNILGDPLERDLPAFYVPAAVDHLLPRLVATWGRDGYMVASYVPERREVMSRYLDVQPPAEVSVPGGGRREAYIVSSRIGFTGEPTRHYVDAETFNWLGSITPSQGVQVFVVTRDQALAELEALSNR